MRWSLRWLTALITACLRDVAWALTTEDVMATKVWFDRFVFNNTLKTVRAGPEKGMFKSCEEKAREQNLSPWPPSDPPAFCLLGLGLSSLMLLKELLQRFPELQVHILYLDGNEGQKAAEIRGAVQDFVQTMRESRRSLISEHEGLAAFDGLCHAVSWSADTPHFSFGRYASLFGRAEYTLALVNLNGCTPETRHEDADKYYCEYLYGTFRGTLCGQVNEDKNSEFQGEDWMFPLVDTECSDTLCMCHTRADELRDDVHVDPITCPGSGMEPTFASQWGQDFFLYHNVFVTNLRRGVGTYVDIGASHPNHLSNTKFFDHCFGWRGLCVEPNPRMRPLLHAFRSCEVVSKCSWSKVTTLKFGQGGELAAPTDDDTLIPSEPFTMDVESTAPTFFEAECNPLGMLLEDSEFAQQQRRGQNEQRVRIDLLSIDVEGAEIDVLKDFDFSRWDIRCIVVETSRRSAMAIDSILLPRGFVQVAILGKDAVYVSRLQLRSMPLEGLTLPENISWNEPGSDRLLFSFSGMCRCDVELDAVLWRRGRPGPRRGRPALAE
eukprot:TRINITY_DN26949_c0_g1_i1.p1 TRINITY_DN26949_c0_g1~~TRINITY_DN26949_c0_g1_i1.p1  ORF type:complete len:550 (+),score=79.70 TRINITY_DN26949_c0_g1_i1:75-1724(+)